MPNMRVTAAVSSKGGNDTPRVIGGDDSFTKLLLHCNGVGSTFTDESGSVHTVLASGGVAQTKGNKKFGFKAAYFDGDGDYLEIPSPVTDFEFGASEEFAVDFWISMEAVDQSQYFLSKGDFNTDGYALYYDQSAGNLYLVKNGSNIVTYSWSPVVDKWYHMAIVGDGTDIDIYIDGISVASITQVSLG